MLPKFFDRERELEFLNRVYVEESFKLVVLYGRRRVGKTRLINEFISKKRGLYFLATDESFDENLKSLKKKFYGFTGKKYFLNIETKSLYDLFELFVKEIGKTKCVIAIDEFPYLMSTRQGILSLFQKIVDELLVNTNIMLILCGSAMSVMESEVLGHKTPLYGRNVNVWKVQPFDAFTVCRLFKNFFEPYFVFGGVPYYLQFYDDRKSLMENIKINFLSKGQNLYDEPLILLRQEFRESRTYRLILKYISLGYKSVGKLCSATGIDKSNLMKYLSSLEEVGLIRHIVPFGMKRKGIYEIRDNLFRFWFRFIYPVRDLLEIGNEDVVLENIKKDLDDYFGLCFEYLVEEILKSGAIERLRMFNEVHKWWHKDKEIDILALNEKNKEILACECKWKDKVNALRIVKDLIEKLEYVDWNKDKRKETLAIFAKSFSKKINSFEGRKVYCFDLRELGRVCRRRVRTKM